MKKLLQIFIAFGFFFASAQTFLNPGFESVSCATDCTAANSQMDCVDDWFENHVVAVNPLLKSFCNSDLVCSGDYSIRLDQSSGAPGSSVKTGNPFSGMNLNGMPVVVNVTAKVIDQWSTSGTGVHIGGSDIGPGSISTDIMDLGFTDPPQNDVCVDMGIILDPSVVNYDYLVFATSVLSHSHLGGHSTILDDVSVCGDLFTITDNCGDVTIALNDSCGVTGIDISDMYAEITDPSGNTTEVFNDTGAPLHYQASAAGAYQIYFVALYELNGDFKLIEINQTYNVDAIVAEDVVITANGIDITNNLEYIIPCEDDCFNLNATNITNAVYNTSAQVFTDLNGLFCVPEGSNLESFIATITGLDSCGNQYSEQVLIKIEQDCCADEPYIEPYWNHPNCPEIVCTADEWPIHVLSSDGTPITSAGGVTLTWVNQDTGETHNQDWIYAEPHETWVVTITYPDGCEYVVSYVEDCCEGEVIIDPIECPEESEIRQMEKILYASRSTYNAADFAAMEKRIASLKDNLSRGELDCDPCDEGTVLVTLIDGQGDPIDPGCVIVWSDGGTGTMRELDVDTLYTVTVTKDNGEYICVYEDEFIYDCRVDCTELDAPTNLQVTGTTLSWDPVPGAISYIVRSPAGPQISCNCQFPISIAPHETTATSWTLPPSLENKCFVWQVIAVCADGTESPSSQQMCYGAKGGHGDGRKDMLENTLVSPNPNNGNMSFTVEANYDTEVRIEVYDFYGRNVYISAAQLEKQSTKTLNWNASDTLAKGVYFVKFKTAFETINKMVIVE